MRIASINCKLLLSVPLPRRNIYINHSLTLDLPLVRSYKIHFHWQTGIRKVNSTVCTRHTHTACSNTCAISMRPRPHLRLTVLAHTSPSCPMSMEAH